jgi:O-antigen ligase
LAVSDSGEVYSVYQLFGTGIFSDPNDLCLLLTIGIGLSLYLLGDRRSAVRWFWVVPLLGFIYALYLTKSRGGFLAMLGCILAFCLARFGWKKAIPVVAILLPLMFVLFAGRQTNLSTSSGTGQGRIQYWAMAFPLFRESPLFGIGGGMLPGFIHHDAHNSYVTGYVDLGFFGGTLFLGVYACAFWGLFQLGRFQDQIQDPELRRIRPYLLAMAAGYATGMLSLTRTYINPTYLLPAVTAAYLRLAAADARVPLPLPRVDAWHVRRLVALSIVFIACTYAYIRLFARFGG